jgi:hypothetical protein
MKLFAVLSVLWAAALTWLGLYHPYGLRFAMGMWPVPPGTPWTYQLESGFVPALTVLTLLSAVTSLYHLHNCHVETCWRLGKHRINGSPYCNVHKDSVKPVETIEELARREIALLTEIRDELRGSRVAARPLKGSTR